MHVRRPQPADAIQTARDHFVAGHRVDMRAVAEQLGVGRTTLYRWFGDRETLLAEMLAQLADTANRRATAESSGQGDERVLDSVRRFMLITSTWPPLLEFLEREPSVALRVLMVPSRAVFRRLSDLTADLIATSRNCTSSEVAETADVLTQIGMAYQWAAIASGQNAAIDQAIRAMRVVLNATTT